MAGWLDSAIPAMDPRIGSRDAVSTATATSPCARASLTTSSTPASSSTIR